jgi:hypothetical protein
MIIDIQGKLLSGFRSSIFRYLSDENYSKNYQLEAVSELRP